MILEIVCSLKQITNLRLKCISKAIISKVVRTKNAVLLSTFLLRVVLVFTSLLLCMSVHLIICSIIIILSASGMLPVSNLRNENEQKLLEAITKGL